MSSGGTFPPAAPHWRRRSRQPPASAGRRTLEPVSRLPSGSSLPELFPEKSDMRGARSVPADLTSILGITFCAVCCSCHPAAPVPMWCARCPEPARDRVPLYSVDSAHPPNEQWRIFIERCHLCDAPAHVGNSGCTAPGGWLVETYGGRNLRRPPGRGLDRNTGQKYYLGEVRSSEARFETGAWLGEANAGGRERALVGKVAGPCRPISIFQEKTRRRVRSSRLVSRFENIDRGVKNWAVPILDGC